MRQDDAAHVVDRSTHRGEFASKVIPVARKPGVDQGHARLVSHEIAVHERRAAEPVQGRCQFHVALSYRRDAADGRSACDASGLMTTIASQSMTMTAENAAPSVGWPATASPPAATSSSTVPMMSRTC